MGILADMMTLREYLADRQMTQSAFAALIGVNQATVAKLCGDKPKLSIATAIDVEKATAGNVPVEVWPQFEALAHRMPLSGEGSLACPSDNADADSARQPAQRDYPEGAA
jgi:DNA-binding transcriptional regulator YdaS (Cro superfamily)